MERSEPSIAFLGESRPSLDQQSVVGLDHSFAQVRDDVCHMLVWSREVARMIWFLEYIGFDRSLDDL